MCENGLIKNTFLNTDIYSAKNEVKLRSWLRSPNAQKMHKCSEVWQMLKPVLEYTRVHVYVQVFESTVPVPQSKIWIQHFFHMRNTSYQQQMLTCNGTRIALLFLAKLARVEHVVE